MTEHVCTNPNHDHFDPSRFNPRQLETLAKAAATHDAARALPGDETKVLCAQQAVYATQQILKGVAAMLVEQGGNADLLQVFGSALAANSLAGVVLEGLAEGHDDWHSSGDQRVDKVFDMLTEMLASSEPPTLSPEDLPEDVAKRLLAGESTPEDKETVRQMAVERGLIGEDDEFEMVARNLETGESVPVASSETSDGYGMYL
jgi:hypothetical protein